MPKISFKVTLSLPEGVSKTDVRDYIRDAVSGWSGQFEPPNQGNSYTGDPRWGLGKDVTVAYYYKPISLPTAKYED